MNIVKEDNFFSIIGFDRENVINISLTYQGVTVYLEETQKNSLLDMLDKAEMDGVARENNIPFKSCEYVFEFITKDELCYPLEICWFDGIEFKVNGISNILDNRVDIKLGANWYTFRQLEDTKWNSFEVEMLFKHLAEKQNINVPQKYELEGYDEEITENHGYPTGYQYVGMTAEEIMEAADAVVTCSFIRLEKMDEGTYVPLSSKQIVIVNEVLKGNLNLGDEIAIYCDFYELENDESVSVHYTHVYDPMLEKGKEYLFCLNYEEGWGTEEVPYGIYVVEAGVYGSAIICDGILYARFNTEYHPFFGYKLEELR